MDTSAGNFFSGLLNGFAQTKQRQEQQAQDKKERDARVKLYEIQLQKDQENLKQQQQVDFARQAVAQKLAQASQPGQVARPPLLNAGQPAKQMSLTDLLADPATAMQFLQAGMLKTDDLLTQENNRQNRAMLSNVMGGAGGTTGAPGSGMVLSGVKIGPNGQLMPDFAPPPITSPQTVETPGGARIKTFDPRTGKEVADLGQPKADTVTPDTAGRVSGLIQAKQIAGDVASKYIDQNGHVDRATVISSFARAPGSEGRKVRDDLAIAIDSVLRARTGAGVNKEEMQQVLDQFLPHPFDSDAEIVNKMGRLNQFIGGSLDAVTLPPSVQKRMGQQGRVIDFNDLPHK